MWVMTEDGFFSAVEDRADDAADLVGMVLAEHAEMAEARKAGYEEGYNDGYADGEEVYAPTDAAERAALGALLRAARRLAGDPELSADTTYQATCGRGCACDDTPDKYDYENARLRTELNEACNALANAEAAKARDALANARQDGA